MFNSLQALGIGSNFNYYMDDYFEIQSDRRDKNLKANKGALIKKTQHKQLQVGEKSNYGG